jgi:hypothetical protein
MPARFRLNLTPQIEEDEKRSREKQRQKGTFVEDTAATGKGPSVSLEAASS